MKYVITIIRKIFPKELPKPVGRWRIEYSNKQMNSNIDLSNEGPLWSLLTICFNKFKLHL